MPTDSLILLLSGALIGLFAGIVITRPSKKCMSTDNNHQKVDVDATTPFQYLSRNYPISFNTIRSFLPPNGETTTVGAIIDKVVNQYDLNHAFLVTENVLAALRYFEHRGELETDMGVEHNRPSKNSEIRTVAPKVNEVESGELIPQS